jgi:glutamate synthase (NADPH/NADH) small chain
VLQTHAAHEEGGSREFGLMVTRFSGARGRVQRVHALPVRPAPQTERRFEPTGHPEVVIDADLVLLAIGFDGTAEHGLLDGLGVARDAAGRVVVDSHFATTAPRVFACGDASRGASLVVWAIAEGRAAARSCDRELVGATRLP